MNYHLDSPVILVSNYPQTKIDKGVLDDIHKEPPKNTNSKNTNSVNSNTKEKKKDCLIY
jgi:hypothetical protein